MHNGNFRIESIDFAYRISVVRIDYRWKYSAVAEANDLCVGLLTMC